MKQGWPLIGLAIAPFVMAITAARVPHEQPSPHTEPAVATV